MNILIIGSSAREHAMACALLRSPQKPHIYCYGTTLNSGIKQMASAYCVGDITDIEKVAAQAKTWGIHLALIGPEAPLEKGLADQLWAMSIPTIGPKQKSAQIEASKGFARDLMSKYAIPGLPRYRIFNTIQAMQNIEAFLHELGEDAYVIKADGLMGGKGVKVGGEHLHSINDALQFCEAVLQQKHAVVIEEKLIGQEFSLMAFCDGTHLHAMPIVQDHKRAFLDDQGPNTGGMGSFSDVNHSLPFLTADDVSAANAINQAVIAALTQETQEKYIGILYGSFIATAKGIYVIEFNARFGDPEALNVLTILTSDFVAICQAMVWGQLTQIPIHFARKATVCKYAVPEGYPDAPVKDECIDIAAVKNKKHLYLGAVDTNNGKMLATGSRTVAYVGEARTLSEAEKIAEREISAVTGRLFHREDIGKRHLIQKRIDMMQALRRV